MTSGPMTDIALLDSSGIEAQDMSMQPPIVAKASRMAAKSIYI
jgi:hypothetical protein